MISDPSSRNPLASSEALKLLIVEDESVVALDLEERLLRLGYEVTSVVNNGADALSHARSEKIDLVLMDIHIHGDLDGIQTAHAMRQIADIPVVFLTAHADEATLLRAGQTEPFGYVLKPFDERELRATIQMAHYRHRAETRLRKMERWLSTTLRSIGDGVIATDSEGRITFINAMAEAISGWSRGEAIGRPLPEVFAITTADGPDETLELLHRAMMEEVTITLGEGRFLRTQDGRMVPVDDSLAPIRDDQGFTTGCVVIFRDNTAQVEADQARRELEEKMQEAQRLESLGVLASGIAHDFNNLLTAVTCNASLSRITNPGNLPLVESMEAIEEAAERASILCRQMLDYAGKNQVKLQNFDLSAFTRDTTQLLQVAISKNAGLRFDLEENLPPCCADISQIQQVIMNLVINGSEALGGLPGTIEVRTRRFQATRAFLSTCRTGAELDEGEYLLLEVSDTGSGMTPEVLSRIFDPFFTTKFTGRGLGLAAISGIVRTHGGALAVQSAPGQGSVFQVILPIAKTAAPPAQVPAPHAAWRGSGRVLFVDDELAIRLAGSALIRRLGFAVETAQDGQEGVEKALAAGADYVIVMLDLTMPKLDGHAAFRAIRAQQPTQPILLMSGYSSQQVASLFQSETPVSFLQKPFTLASLIAALRPLLSHQPGA